MAKTFKDKWTGVEQRSKPWSSMGKRERKSHAESFAELCMMTVKNDPPHVKKLNTTRRKFKIPTSSK